MRVATVMVQNTGWGAGRLLRGSIGFFTYCLLCSRFCKVEEERKVERADVPTPQENHIL